MDKLPGLGDMGGMLKQLKQMQADLMKAQKELAKETVIGEAGKGAVKVTVTGDQKATKIEFDSNMIDASDTRKLAELTKEAMNNALDASRELAKERLGPLSQGLAP
jgi:DNA-binding YbaB/EbfC family protein